MNAVLSPQSQIITRTCLAGESYTDIGRCEICKETVEYLLIAPVEPTTCLECPSEAICFGGNLIGSKSGYWRNSVNSSSFIRCPNIDACEGVTSSDQNLMGECAEGYEGVLCANCKVGYSRSRDFTCEKCPNAGYNIFKLVGFFVLAIILISLIIRSTLAYEETKKGSLYFHTVYLRIFMNHIQLILVISIYALDWPGLILVLFQSVETISNSAFQIFSLDCFFDERSESNPLLENSPRIFYKKLLLVLFSPFVVIIGALLIWLIIKWKKKSIKYFKEKIITTIVVIISIMHPTITKYIFDCFNCSKIANESHLRVDFEEICWEGSHYAWTMGLAFPYLILWVLVIPLLGAYLLFRNRKKLSDIQTKIKYGFLYHGYKNHKFYWEFVIFYRKIIMISIAVFFINFGVITQSLIVLLVLIVSLLGNTNIKPFKTSSLNNIETFSLIVISLTIYIGLYLISGRYEEGLPITTPVEIFFFIVIVNLNIALFISIGWFLVQELRRMLRRRNEKLFIWLCYCCRKRRFSEYQIEVSSKEDFNAQKLRILIDLQKIHDYITSIPHNPKVISQLLKINTELASFQKLLVNKVSWKHQSSIFENKAFFHSNINSGTSTPKLPERKLNVTIEDSRASQFIENANFLNRRKRKGMVLNTSMDIKHKSEIIDHSVNQSKILSFFRDDEEDTIKNSIDKSVDLLIQSPQLSESKRDNNDQQ